MNIFFSILFIFLSTFSYSQTYVIENYLEKDIKLTSSDLHKLKQDFIKKGYPFVSFDSVSSDLDSQFMLRLSRNQKMDKIILYTYSSFDSSIVDLYKFDDLYPYMKSKLYDLFLLGYVKASFDLDTFYVHNSNLTAKYKINLNQKFAIDSIRIYNQNNTIDREFLRNILNSKRNEVHEYNISKVIEEIQFMSFLEMEKSPDLSISDNKAILNLYITSKRQNKVDAIIGLLSNGYESGQVQISADVKLSLTNLFKRGVMLDLNWQKNLLNSQFLYLKSSIPYVLNTPIGLGLNFALEKYDSSFLRINTLLNFNYSISSKQSISLIYNQQSSDIFSVDTARVLNNILPNSLDYSYTQFGFGYKYNTIQKPFFNKSGFKIDASMLIGRKNILINSKIASLINNQGESMKKLYDTIPLSQINSSLSIDIVKYTLLSRYVVSKSQIQSKVYFANTINQNEMYNLGGIKFPRGFDDNSLLTSKYITFAQDFQYYISDYFYSNIFADISLMMNESTSQLNYPIGLGLGFSLQSNSNVFQFNIGSGNLNNQSFSLSNSKVHIQYINVF